MTNSDIETVDTQSIDVGNLGGNIPVYLQESELRAITRALQSYPGCLHDEAKEGLHKLEKTLEIVE